MKRNSITGLLILAFLIFKYETLLPSVILPGEDNSINLADELSKEIIDNPSGALIPFYIEQLLEIAPAAGRSKISAVFKEAVVKLNNSGESGALTQQLLRLSIDELDGNYNESINNFSILRKWNISGPWKRYGMPDIDYEFNPEKSFQFDKVEKGYSFSADENGFVYPFKYKHDEYETYYASCSFTAEEGIIIWIISDSEYKLLINGREIYHNKLSGKRNTIAFLLNGARGYSIQVKMQCGSEGSDPYFRGMITNGRHQPVKQAGTVSVFNYNFTAEKIFSSDDTERNVPGDASVLTGRMRDLIHSGDYAGGYKLGGSITGKFPFYFPAYKEFIPLLDLMSRDDEFLAGIEKFRKIFPYSGIHDQWLADFYMTRDKDKFSGLMKSVQVNRMSDKAVEAYLYLLCGQKRYSEALALCSSLKYNKHLKHIFPAVAKESGDNNLWRKSLIDATAAKGESGLYYQLGLAEMHLGLDPVMYWQKGYSMEDDSVLMRDLSDIYENSILGVNDFYTGLYTDLHPEFGWNGKRRKITVHVFESGRVLLEGEDMIPSGRKFRNEKYSEGGIEFSSGEMKTDIPYISGLKILYVMTARDGLPSRTDFSSSLTGKNRLTVNYKSSGDEEFSVIRYSGEYINGKNDIFSFLNNIILKEPQENISMLEYEVICYGNFKPLVKYRGEVLSPGKYSNGVIKYGITDRFDEGDNEQAVSDILKFSSGKVFAEWYGEVLIYVRNNTSGINITVPDPYKTEDIIKGVHFYVMSAIAKSGDVNFGPCEMITLLNSRKGTVEERTLLAKALFDANGIQSFISFRKNRDGLIDKILLYVPEKRNRGYWLDFYGEGISDKTESGYEALVITGEGYETFPVNPETYIR